MIVVDAKRQEVRKGLFPSRKEKQRYMVEM